MRSVVTITHAIAHIQVLELLFSQLTRRYSYTYPVQNAVKIYGCTKEKITNQIILNGGHAF